MGFLRTGLRTRLVITYILISVLSAGATAVAGYVEARTTILRDSQDPAVGALTNAVGKLADAIKIPLSQDGLDELAYQLQESAGGDIVTVFGELRSRAGPPLGGFSAELREAVRHGTSVVWQRVMIAGDPVLTIGMPFLIEAGEKRTPSGLEIYSSRPMLAEQESVDRMATAQWTGIIAVVIAIVFALLAAHSVLRPVRELAAAAKRWGRGELDTRLQVRGSDELAELGRTFNQSADAVAHHVAELERVEADARRFVADVSHELRTPLAAMTAVTDVLDEEAEHLTGDAAAAARLVSRETRNLNRLVADLIEVSRFDSGTAALILDDVDMGEAVASSLRARGWSEQVAVELPAGLTARLDPRRLDVIMANLVGNALSHGGEPVEVRLSAGPEEVVIEVADHGPGLAPDVIGHVFDRFYKADSARGRSAGSGLGLAIARENARLHGGELSAANRPGGGAVFTLRLPRRRA
ncbi:sensor histidine kinase [Phytomonospora endophytica]|uniref:histidine kinase n=1 Tax=Phytomonospora endophytica TaxID=714109 RepID=A0A841FNM1_9ACTN|nr:HAMP domain-containing sensor histidine kinase [Phytomonospora endophytica]MBB6038911.1 two-component system sensor histidine kinase MtrB [Phytomonospora endophytica]GIG67987.1 two-component sensor histidine kinase [Phytomonospora endophytica]